MAGVIGLILNNTGLNKFGFSLYEIYVLFSTYYMNVSLKELLLRLPFPYVGGEGIELKLVKTLKVEALRRQDPSNRISTLIGSVKVYGTVRSSALMTLGLKPIGGPPGYIELPTN